MNWEVNALTGLLVPYYVCFAGHAKVYYLNIHQNI